MKALFIGGTGTISTAIVRRLAEELGWEVWLFNRGNRADVVPEGVHQIIADISDEAAVAQKLEGMEFDVVNEFIGFVPEQVERDYRLFRGKTKQYIFISSASAYHKPAAGYIITEGYSPRTGIPGIYAAGDVADPHYRQAIVAAASGAKAAMEAEKFIKENE